MNIILQHWSGPMDEVTERSSQNMKAYADMLGVEYRLLLGDVFQEGWSGQSQKLVMLDEQFDEYDQVCMIDADMFVVKGMTDNVFDLKGYGMCEPVHASIRRKLASRGIGNDAYSYWGGAIYRLPRDIRQRLREQLVIDEISQFKQSAPHDEGMVFILSSKAKIKDPAYIDPVWCASSFFMDHSHSKIIHIRPKMRVQPLGPRQPKIDNLMELINEGIIDGNYRPDTLDHS